MDPYSVESRGRGLTKMDPYSIESIESIDSVVSIEYGVHIGTPPQQGYILVTPSPGGVTKMDPD